MKYKVINPIAWSGRRERGEIIEMTELEASNFSKSLLPIDAVIKQEEVQTKIVPKSIDELSIAELKEKAKELGLSVRGTKSDLIERITLFQAEEINS